MNKSTVQRTLTLSEANVINVGVIESNRLFREHLVELIDSQPDMRLSFSFPAIDTAQMEFPADVVLSQAGKALQQLAECANAKLIAIDVDPEQMDLVRCIQSGIAGFVLRDSTFEDLLGTVRAVAQNKKVVPPDLMIGLWDQLSRRGRKDYDYFENRRITIRERQILSLVTEGLTNKEIADKLNIATHTVKSHVHSILEKLEVKSRIQLVMARYTVNSQQRPA